MYDDYNDYDEEYEEHEETERKISFEISNQQTNVSSVFNPLEYYSYIDISKLKSIPDYKEFGIIANTPDAPEGILINDFIKRNDWF